MSHQSIFEDCWEDAETRVAGLEDHLRLERVVDERFRVVGDEPVIGYEFAETGKDFGPWKTAG